MLSSEQEVVARTGKRRMCVFWYTQTGQLTESVTAFVTPLREQGWDVRWIEVQPYRRFPFPWPVRQFFNIFPACVDRAATIELEPIASTLYPGSDEILLFAFQVWYLSPSLPMRSVLVSEREAFRNRDVVTFTACRNMWWSAAIEVHRLLDVAGARYLGTIAASDTSPQFHSLVTTLRWLLGGRGDPFWLFGRAGIPEAELARLKELGETVAAVTATGTPSVASSLASALREHGAAPIYPTIAAADLLGSRVFRMWGAVIRSASRYGALPRAAALGVFIGFLCGAILIGFPVLAIARLTWTKPFDAAVIRSLDRALGSGHLEESP
jgi:hypothetical protein